MAQFCKLQVAFMLIILRISGHVRAVQLKNMANDSLAHENITSRGALAQEKDTLVRILPLANQTNPSYKKQVLKGGKHLWTSHMQSLAIIPMSHQSRQDANNFISCDRFSWGCADGFQCIPQVWRCDAKADCIDGSDESESLCTPPCSTDMFVCADGLQCVHKSAVCDGITVNCEDGSDESEALCTPPCPVDMFACVDGLRCIFKIILCDEVGYPHCGDG